MRLHRISGIDLVPFRIAGYPGLSRKNSIVSDGNMACTAHLAGKDAVITRLGTAGNPYLGYDEAVFPDFHIMAEMDKIVYFSTPFDNGAVKSSIIDARTGPDFYVIADFDIANLGNARPSFVAKPKPSPPITAWARTTRRSPSWQFSWMTAPG